MSWILRWWFRLSKENVYHIGLNTLPLHLDVGPKRFSVNHYATVLFEFSKLDCSDVHAFAVKLTDTFSRTFGIDAALDIDDLQKLKCSK